MQVKPSELTRLILQETKAVQASGLSTSPRLESLRDAWTTWLRHLEQRGERITVNRVRI